LPPLKASRQHLKPPSQSRLHFRNCGKLQDLLDGWDTSICIPGCQNGIFRSSPRSLPVEQIKKLLISHPDFFPCLARGRIHLN
ncbi:hypothetical protein EBZ37_09970, partial [bacterium]|nr:hypothetical protein [bacterium]